MIWLGIGVGSPLLGWISDRIHSRRIALLLSSVFGLTATIFLLYVPNIPLNWMYLVLFFLGLGAGGQTVSFAVVKDNNSPELVGTASGFNNLSVLIGAAVFQPLVGVFLNRFGVWQELSGIRIYTISSFTNALLIMPLCFLLSLLLVVFFLKESHPGHAVNSEFIV